MHSRVNFAVVCCLATGASSILPEQLRVALHADSTRLVATWVAVSDATGLAGALRYGSARGNLTTAVNATATMYTNEVCANSSRTVFVADFPAPSDVSTYYSVTADGGTWSAEFEARSFNPLKENLRLSIFGDMGVNTATRNRSAVYALANDTRDSTHDVVLHVGDVGYNMEDQCGAVGDTFLRAAQSFSSTTPTQYAPGNHETGPWDKYVEYVARLGPAQASLGALSESNSTEYYAVTIGRVRVFFISADFYIYPLVWGRAAPQWAWLDGALARVNRTETPWVVLATHRAMYCTKVADDGECNSEAETLRTGFLGQEYGLEQLLVKYGVDFVWSGHTHHFEVTWPVKNRTATQLNYVEPRGPVHIQAGIAGVDGNDPFDVPQEPWERFRDTTFTPCYTRLTIHNETHATVSQLWASNGTVGDTFTVVQHSHGPFV